MLYYMILENKRWYISIKIEWIYTSLYIFMDIYQFISIKNLYGYIIYQFWSCEIKTGIYIYTNLYGYIP